MFYSEVARLFKGDKWDTSVKVVQKDENFMSVKTITEVVKSDNVEFAFINCIDWVGTGESYYNEEIVTDRKFAISFTNFCTNILGSDFKSYEDESLSPNEWWKNYTREHNGSGATALFWLYYNLYYYSKECDITNIVIDNIDGLLHPLSMAQLCRVMKELKGFKVIFFMNCDELFTNYYMEIDNLYVMKHQVIKNIRDCTDRELRIEHNLQNLYRAGEFDFTEEA